MPEHCIVCDIDLVQGKNWSTSSYDNFVMHCNDCIKKTHKISKDKIKKRREQKHHTEDELDRLKAACKTFRDQVIVYEFVRVRCLLMDFFIPDVKKFVLKN